LLAPDIAQHPELLSRAKPAGDDTQLGGFIRSKGRRQSDQQMISSSSRRASKLKMPKPSGSQGELAERFLEWQRLRKQVHELERLAATALKQDAPCARTDGGRRRR
jgi:hypothetical protein